jgi:hypothetical protein
MADSSERRLFSVAVLAVTMTIAGMSSPAAAQSSGAALRGRVVDQTDAPIPGVTVTATSPDTGLSRSVDTANDGSYVIASLPVGIYDVTVKIPGFKTVERKKVELNVASTVTIDATLEVARVEETVSVSAQVPIVSTDVAVGSIVSRREL